MNVELPMSEIIKVGDVIPSATFGYTELPEGTGVEVCVRPGSVSTDSWKGKKIVLFGVPGAFTPTCSESHLPGYLEKRDELAAKGVDDVYCIATNDGFVMSAWGRALKTGTKVKCISDADLAWLPKVGLVIDPKAPFVRSKRFALIIDDLKVTYVGVETAPGVTVSGVDAVLAKL